MHMLCARKGTQNYMHTSAAAPSACFRMPAARLCASLRVEGFIFQLPAIIGLRAIIDHAATPRRPCGQSTSCHCASTIDNHDSRNRRQAVDCHEVGHAVTPKRLLEKDQVRHAPMSLLHLENVRQIPASLQKVCYDEKESCVLRERNVFQDTKLSWCERNPLEEVCHDAN